MRNKAHQLQKLVNEYRKTGQEWPASTTEIAKWAINNEKYNLTGPVLEKHCARELAQAMREEFFTDSYGRRVRAKHPAKVETNGQIRFVWDDIRTASHTHMQSAFRLRRRRIAAECKQIKTDVDSYNDEHPEKTPIQMPLDFTYDVEEMELAEAYSEILINSSEPSKQSTNTILEPMLHS